MISAVIAIYCSTLSEKAEGQKMGTDWTVINNISTCVYGISGLTKDTHRGGGKDLKYLKGWFNYDRISRRNLKLIITRWVRILK